MGGWRARETQIQFYITYSTTSYTLINPHKESYRIGIICLISEADNGGSQKLVNCPSSHRLEVVVLGFEYWLL